MEGIRIIDLREREDLLEEGIRRFHGAWGHEANEPFYRDCIVHACRGTDPLPRFFLALEGDAFAGGYALLRNDLNSRQDLCPWLACLYVDPERRGRGLATRLLDHGLATAASLGFTDLHLTSDLEGFYEPRGWRVTGRAWGPSGGSLPLFHRATGA